MNEACVTPELREQMSEGLDTKELLYAVDFLDNIRGQVGDRENYRPPEIRDSLMKLHEVTRRVLDSGDTCTEDFGLFDLAWEIENDIETIQEHADKILAILDKITKFANAAYGEEYEEEL